MKKLQRLSNSAFCVLVSLVSGGCLSASFVQTGASKHPPRGKYCAIEVFSSRIPDRDYDEIGIVEGTGSLWKADMDDVLPRMKEEACLVGGEALIMGSSDTFTEGENTRSQRVTATVIRWKAP
jgi:hypothetical protein